MEEVDKKKVILKIIHCFNGPVHQAFVYTYYQAYVQDTDMYTYAIATGLQNLFYETELHILKNEHRPSHLSLPLLYKVLQTCCSPSLAKYDDALWRKENDFVKFTSSFSIESILGCFSSVYKKFLGNCHKLSIEDGNQLIDDLSYNVSILVERAAEFLNSKRWIEENERLQKMFGEIKNGSIFSFRTSISDVVNIEAQFRADLYNEMLGEELKDIDGLAWDLQTVKQNSEGELSNNFLEYEEKIEVDSILSCMFKESKRICWIAGEHGVGKSTLAAYFISSWNSKIDQVLDLQKIGAMIAVSLTDTQFMDEKNIAKILVPLTSLFLDDCLLDAWMKDVTVLLIVDDVSKSKEKKVEQICKTVANQPNVLVWFMGRYSAILKYAELPLSSQSIFLHLNGLKYEKILSLSEKWTKSEEELPSLKAKLKSNMNRLGDILRYPIILQWTSQIWLDKSGSLKDVYTTSELMWEILSWKVKLILKINIKVNGPARKKFFQWLMLAGELSLYSLKADLRVDKQSLEELEGEIVQIFSDKGKKLLDTFFKPSITHTPISCFDARSSTSKPFIEYLSSWFLVDQLLKRKPLSELTTDSMANILPMILFAAGHLERFQDEGGITVVDERYIIKALVTYREGSYEDFSFIQKFVAELKCIKRLVELVIDETEYNEEWNINVADIQQKSLEVLLNHVSPTRLIFLADESKKNYELSSVMNYICRKDISVWLDSIPQFSYGNTQTLDKLLKPFMGELVVPKVDLISGCLSSSVMEMLCNSNATKHLVLLRLSVSSEKQLNVALSLPKQLPQLLWLEVKIDMNFGEIDSFKLQSTEVPMFDIHLRGVDNSNVADLTGLLMTIHLRFTGIHLEETQLTPEGVFTLLKELGKRGVALCAEEDSINKFRRWYYPSLSSLPKWKKLSEDQYKELIGHDDREFYSDHHVISSRFVTALDAWNLRNYLENQPKIVHFVYEASNIIFSKQLDGKVKISFKGDYKEAIVDKVKGVGIDDDHNSQSDNTHDDVMDFY